MRQTEIGTKDPGSESVKDESRHPRIWISPELIHPQCRWGGGGSRMGTGSRDCTVTLISVEAAPHPALPQRGPRPSIRARTHGLEAPAPSRLATVLPGPDRSGVAGVLSLRVHASWRHRSPSPAPTCKAQRRLRGWAGRSDPRGLVRFSAQELPPSAARPDPSRSGVVSSPPWPAPCCRLGDDVPPS